MRAALVVSLALVASSVLAGEVARPAATIATLAPVRFEQPAEPAPVIGGLLEIASEVMDSPARRDARNRLFHEVVPRIAREGRALTTSERAELLPALAGFPCASGILQVSDASALGDCAMVQVGGSQGGCSVLMRRAPEGWRFVMVLGWTIAS